MWSEIVSIGPVTIHGYGLMIAIGVMAALFIGEAQAKKKGLNPDAIFSITLISVFAGFFSAKILFCIVEWKSFISNPAQTLSGNGFVVYGGIIGGVLASYLYCRLKKLQFWAYFDLVLPCVAIAQGFGRIGCFLAGCCYGRETDSVLGIVFTNSNQAPNGVKLLPVQLFSSAGMFMIAVALFWYAAKKAHGTGQVGASYMVLYSLGRFGIEFLRNDYRGAVGPFSTSQFISLFIFMAGIVLFICKKPRTDGQNGEKNV